jgi:tetratricopeptide (TPR) repeat protein
VGDWLRALWDFSDLTGSRRRFEELLGSQDSGTGRAEVLTQLARVHGLRGEFAEADRLLDEADALAGAVPIVRARVCLERGRLRRSAGDETAALPLFEQAFAVASDAGEEFIAVDAAHMAAIAAPAQDERERWTHRAIDLATSATDQQARHWLGPLWNNVGWSRFEADDHEGALAAFQEALQARERQPDRPYEIEIARYAVAKTLRALGRPAEAAALLERAVAWARENGMPDGWFHEELAETYAALGRHPEAAEHARLAIDLLDQSDSDFPGDTTRTTRLRTLAGELDRRK